MRPKANDLREIDIDAIEALTRPYRNALDHRNTIVEGIRKVAARNMIHLTDAMKRCETSGVGDERDDQWLARVQGAMLQDQGLEDNQLSRILIALGTFYPLQIYLALLYAEVEFYEKTSEKLLIYRNSKFRGLLDLHQPVIAELKKFRDSFLHPSPHSVATERRFLDTDESYNIAPALQNAFDEYLGQTKLRIVGILHEHLECLPEVQRLYAVRGFLAVNQERMQAYRDAKGLDHLNDQAGRLFERLDNLPNTIRAWSPDNHQQEVARRLAQCMSDVNPSLSEQQHDPPNNRQAPLPAAMLFASNGEHFHFSKDKRHEANVIKHAHFYRRLVDSASILCNEFVQELQEAIPQMLEEPADSASLKDLGLDEFTRRHTELANERGVEYLTGQACLLRVASALVYEPLRIYTEASKQNPALASGTIDQYLSVPARLTALRDHRNAVFHIQDARCHPLKVDLVMADSEVETAPVSPPVLYE